MKTKINLILKIFVLMLLGKYRCQYVYTQIGENLNFDKTTPQVRQEINLGEEFRFSKQYSIWGWFKYTNGDQPSIMNILNLHNDQEISNNSAIIGPFPNPSYPECPYTSEQIKNIPNIQNQPQVQNNPNCFPQKIDSIDAFYSTLKAKKQDLLYVNFDLVPAQNGQYTFNLTFLIQNGQQTGFSDMKILGFNDIPWLGEHWGFFAISFNYQIGEGTMYFKIFDNSVNNSQIKTFQLNYNDFLLQKQSTITIASVENNNYFEQVAGFTGNIAYIEMSAYYTKNVSTLWSGYMTSSAYDFEGVVLNLEFDMYQNQNIVTSTNGALNEIYQVKGKIESLYEINKNKLGVRFYDNSNIDFGNIDVLNQDLIKAIVFYFKISYKEDLPDELTLVQRGNINQNGFIKISLIKKLKGRHVRIQIKGDDSNQVQTWESSSSLPQDQQTIFQAGIAISPSQAVRIVYIDQYGNLSFELLSDNLNFETNPQKIILLNNPNTKSYQGYVNFFNFKILNSASSVEFENQIQNAAEPQKFTFFDDCLFRSSYYRDASVCFDCKTKVLSIDEFCVDYCAKNRKNPLEQICVSCLEQNCDEIDVTTWTVERIEPKIYRFRPTRRLLNGFTDVDKDILIKFKDEQNFNSKYDYDIKQKFVNQNQQYIDYEFIFKERIIDKDIQFILNEDQQDPQYDVNRNLIFHNDDQIIKEVTLNTVKEGICYLSNNKERALKALAITAMTVFFASVAVLLLLTLFCFKRILHLGALWKFLIHNWMKIQLIAFLLFLTIYMPCCIQEFLHWIYKLAVSWNHALGNAIDNINEDNSNYVRGMESAQPSKRFNDEGIEAFYLHNFGVFFIIQGFFFLLYIILKIWDLLAAQSANCFYKLFVFIEFSGLIALFLVTAMQTFVFSAINWRFVKFYHSYFVMCFLITIFYILFFVIFWIYSLMKLLTKEYAFMNPMVKDRYYYFFTGYKNQKWSRTWDHWMVLSHFIIGMMIGLLLYHELSQLIIITAVLVVLFAITIILRPWRYTIFTIVEILQQILILVGVILFLMIAIYDHSGCLTCGKRESVTCWFVVIMFFLAIILGALGLIAQSLMALTGEEEEEEIVNVQQQNINYSQVQENYENQNLNTFNQNVKNVYNEEVNVTNQDLQTQNIQQHNMQDFMNKIQMDRDESYMSKSQNYSYADGIMQGRTPHELAPDSEDEKYNINSVVRALTANNSFDSDGLEDSKLELDQQRNNLKIHEQKFYESTLKPSFENSFVNDKYDQHKLNNLISNKHISEETVIRNRKINRNTYNSEPYS